jgi:hypothetical protein
VRFGARSSVVRAAILVPSEVEAAVGTHFREYLRCQPGDLIELHPPLDDDARCHVDELYPPRGTPGAADGM